MDNHDVAKHRQHTFWGGEFRMDAPPGYFENLGLSPSDSRRALFCPMAEVHIPKEPKLPVHARSSDPQAWTTLEALITGFEIFMDEAVRLAQRK